MSQVFGVPFGGRCQRQQRIVGVAVNGDHVGDMRTPKGQSAGLVDQHRRAAAEGPDVIMVEHRGCRWRPPASTMATIHHLCAKLDPR
jgi:hypothetical protein